jgi:hypothetical protein
VSLPDPDATTGEAYLESGAAAILLKLATEAYEVNIYIERTEAGRLASFLNGPDGENCHCGVSAGSGVFWQMDQDHLYILIGLDAGAWEIAITLNRNVSQTLYDLLKTSEN